MYILFLLGLTYSRILGLFCIELPVIEISNGLVRGFHDETQNGKMYTAFEGIPFAKAPIGELRFQPPEEPNDWSETLEANQKYACHFFSPNPPSLELEGIIFSEDCLRLNIYIPKETPSNQDNFDVIVHIHSGGFTLGHPHTLSGPKFLIEKEVIYISLTYRLGPLGFLSTKDEVIPGNYGMKDQSMALKWIQKNIQNFGGNPNSVTITGLSAGGASVHLHYMSALSKGLFQKGYSASGTALDPWVLQDGAVEKAKRLANLLNCNSESSISIANCLRGVSYEQLYEATQKFYVNGMPFSPFAPVIEEGIENGFLMKHPYELLLNGSVQDLPWMYGFAADDGIFPAGFYYFELETVDKDWLNFAPHLLDYNFTSSESHRDSISTAIRRKYFGDNPITYHELIKLCSDRHFYRGAENSIRLQNAISTSPIYMLVFAYRGEYSNSEVFGVPSEERGVAHGDDTIYYLSSTIFGRFNDDDERVKEAFAGAVTTFAKTSQPTVEGVEWKPVRKEGKINYLHFDFFDNLSIKEGEDFGSIEFWIRLGLNETP